MLRDVGHTLIVGRDLYENASILLAIPDGIRAQTEESHLVPSKIQGDLLEVAFPLEREVGDDDLLVIIRWMHWLIELKILDYWPRRRRRQPSASAVNITSALE